jgi:HD-like signal output (HDOD) protein
MSTDTNIEELARVIEGDPMLSANILKSVNSPLYGMSKEISSIPQAIVLFGISMIRGFAAANAIKKAMPIDLTPYAITIEHLTEVSTLQTALVREWYRNVDKTMLPLLQSVAFFMELGKLAASLRLIASGEFERFSQEIAQNKPIIEIEKCYLGVSSYEIAAMMFEHWNFESTLVEALRGIANPDTTNPYAKVLSVIVKAVNVRHTLSEEGKNEAFEAIEALGLNRAAFEEAHLSLKARNK